VGHASHTARIAEVSVMGRGPIAMGIHAPFGAEALHSSFSKDGSPIESEDGRVAKSSCATGLFD